MKTPLKSRLKGLDINGVFCIYAISHIFNHTTAFGKAEDISTQMTERRLNLPHGLTFSALERRQCPLWHELCRGGDGEGRI